MFPFFKRPSASKPQTAGSQLMKRTIALGAGLLLLWFALNIMPKQPDAAVQPATFTDEAGTTASSSNIVSAESNSSFDLGKITAGLLLASMIVFGFIWHKKTGGKLSPAESLQVLGKIQLNPNQHIHLVRCGENALLLGATNSQITLLHQVPSKQLENRLESSTIDTKNAPQYSATTSTLMHNPDFGVMLQEHNFSQASLSAETLPTGSN